MSIGNSTQLRSGSIMHRQVHSFQATEATSNKLQISNVHLSRLVSSVAAKVAVFLNVVDRLHCLGIATRFDNRVV